MEIRNLITFTKVAETQSLSQTAKALGYAQSTVTMQMQQLEQELGVQLYERVGRQIRITQTGQEFLSYAAAIVRMSEEALTVGKQEPSAVSGSLRLGILNSLSGQRTGTAIAQYLQDHPQVDLDVQTVLHTEELLFRLRHNELDIVLTLDTRHTDPDLVHAGEDRFVPYHFYAGKGHPLAGQAQVSPEALSFYPILFTGYSGAENITEPGSSFSRKQHISDPNLALSIVSAKSSANGSDMIASVPDLIAESHPAFPDLIRLNCEVPVPGLWLQVLYHRNKWLTGAMKAWLSDDRTLSFSL